MYRYAMLSVLAVLLVGCGNRPTGGGDAATAGPVAPGEELVARSCIVCHSVDGSTGTGPTFQGAWGSTVTFTDGTTTTFDRAYLERATTDPGARIVDGYEDVMPPSVLSDEEFDALEAYLRSLAAS